jgi:hypothetical protein
MVAYWEKATVETGVVYSKEFVQLAPEKAAGIVGKYADHDGLFLWECLPVPYPMLPADSFCEVISRAIKSNRTVFDYVAISEAQFMAFGGPTKLPEPITIRHEQPRSALFSPGAVP